MTWLAFCGESEAKLEIRARADGVPGQCALPGILDSIWFLGKNVNIDSCVSNVLVAGSSFCRGWGDRASSAHRNLNLKHGKPL